MHISTKISAAIASAFLFGAAATAAPAAQAPGMDLSKFVYKVKTESSVFGSDRVKTIDRLNKKMYGSDVRRVGEYLPNNIYGPTSLLGDIDGPNGEVWFYTMELDEDAIEHEWYTEYILRGFKINLFDAEHNPIGSLNGAMEYAEDEVRVPYVDLLPVVTKNFFNDDDKYEFIVGVAINTTTPGYNRYRSFVYQLDGEKDENGRDKMVYQFENLVSDVLDASTPTEEKYYFTMSGGDFGEVPEPQPVEGEEDLDTSYWDSLVAQSITLTTYGKVGADGKMTPLIHHRIPYQNLPGDQENVNFAMSFMIDGEPYILYQQYGETLFNPYYTWDAELTQRESNSLVIEIYHLGEASSELFQKTVIPFTKDDDPSIMASMYSVGNLLYTEDVDTKHYGTDGKAAFIVNKQTMATGMDESYGSSFYVYGSEGNKIFTFAENCDGALTVSNVKGYDPQLLFITYDDGYVFNFVNQYTGKLESSFSNVRQVDGDDDPIMSNIDRVAYGDSYAYVAELRAPLEEDDYTFMRVLWMDSKGEPLFTDEMNMGLAVHYGQTYINAATLGADVFHSDENREYLILIKRGNADGSMSEELIIAQPRNEENEWMGKTLLHLAPNEHGVLGTITPYSAMGINKLSVMYYDQPTGTYATYFYELPLDQNGIAAVAAPGIAEGSAAIAFDGTTLYAAGDYIEVYSLQGIRLAAAADSLDTAALPAGAYIAKTSAGALKFIKK